MEQVIALLRDYGLQILATVVIGYLVGSVSFSIIFTRLFDKKDIRTMGSGNAGFTNVLRSVGKLPSILTFIFDFAKGLLAVYSGMLSFPGPSGAPFIVKTVRNLSGGGGVYSGPCFPALFALVRGGEGVLASAALILIIDWRIFLIVVGVFLIVFLISKIISLASISAAVSLPIGTFLVTYFADYRPNLSYSFDKGYSLAYVVVTTAFSLILAALVVGKHHANIGRILRGEEKKITAKKRKNSKYKRPAWIRAFYFTSSYPRRPLLDGISEPQLCCSKTLFQAAIIKRDRLYRSLSSYGFERLAFSPLPLHSAGNLTRTQATGAGINTLRASIHNCPYTLNVGFPSSVGTSV